MIIKLGNKILPNFIKKIPQMRKNEPEIKQQIFKNIPQLKNLGNTKNHQLDRDRNFLKMLINT